MKKLLLSCFTLLFAFSAQSQLYIEAGAGVFVEAGSKITVQGDISGFSDIQGTGTIAMKGNALQTINMNGFSLANLEIDNASVAGVSLGGSTIVLKSLSFGNVNNARLSSGGYLVLRSNLNGTAYIADITNGGINSGNSITGDVIVERYIPASGRRAWRLLGANISATGAPTILSSWQEGGVATTTGTHITQAGGAGTNGFDASSISGSSSILSWSGTALQALPNTNTTKITDNGGAYFLFVRGNRTIDLNNPSASSNTTLRMTGVVNQGNISKGIAGASFSLIPNPYPSPVDYEAIFAGNTSLNGVYYVWDANLSTVGAYRTIERTATNTYQSTPSTGSTAGDNSMRYFQSGQAFFTPGSSTINFTEGMKSTTVASTNVYRTGTGTEEMTIDLKVVPPGSSNYLADGVRSKYNSNYNNSVDANDISKFNNLNENLALVRNNQVLAVEKRDLVDQTDTIFLKLWNTGIKDYQFDINPVNFDPSANLSAFLEDNFLMTSTPVSLADNSVHGFSITSNSASSAADRFKIVFRPATPLPVNITDIKAFKQELGIQVEWTVETEVNTIRYELEKSIDGSAFNKVASVNANGSKDYKWFDANPNVGSNYYRVKAVDKDNSRQYSRVVNMEWLNDKAIFIFPNPAIDGFYLQMPAMAGSADKITIDILNAKGEKIMSKVAQGSELGNYYISFANAAISSGMYLVRVSTDRKELLTKSIMIQK